MDSNQSIDDIIFKQGVNNDNKTTSRQTVKRSDSSRYRKAYRNHSIGQMTRLKDVRIEKGISQGQIYKATGIYQSSISAWENGNRDFNKAHLQTVIKIADALGVTDLRELADPVAADPDADHVSLDALKAEKAQLKKRLDQIANEIASANK